MSATLAHKYVLDIARPDRFALLASHTAVRVQVSDEELIKFFSTCGNVMYCRLAGDGSHPSRFAFIEFESQLAAQQALLLSGTLLHDRHIKYVSTSPLTRSLARSVAHTSP